MIDWVTAIIPCHHDEKIYGGTIASVNIDGEIEWRVEKKKQVRGSNESNLNIKSLDNTEILLDGNLAKWLQGTPIRLWNGRNNYKNKRPVYLVHNRTKPPWI